MIHYQLVQINEVLALFDEITERYQFSFLNLWKFYMNSVEICSGVLDIRSP